jgi:hypothetical protein
LNFRLHRTQEGFYGRPWSSDQRAEMISKMQGEPLRGMQLAEGREFAGLDTYMYSPKDDRKHRAAWRELYTAKELQELGALASTCATNGVRMICEPSSTAANSVGILLNFATRPALAEHSFSSVVVVVVGGAQMDLGLD